jgi:hypothetical protein
MTSMLPIITADQRLDDPTEHVDVCFGVAERKNSAWPAHIHEASGRARKPKFRLALGEEVR